MALSKSGKTGSNVTNLDDARKLRARNSKTSNTSDASGDESAAGGASDARQPGSPSATPDDRAKPKAARVSNRRFDREKVDRIKAEIAQGEYEIDSLRVADKYIEHERFS